MEESNIFRKRLLEKGQADIEGNKWWVDKETIKFQLTNESFARKFGILLNNRIIMYKTREQHLVNKTNSYGFSIEIIKGLIENSEIKTVDLYDDFGMYRVPIEVINNKGEQLFEGNGFNRQLFVPLSRLEKYIHELPEDKNRKELLGESWFNQLRAEFHKPYFAKLGQAVYKKRQEGTVYPDREDVFKAFKLTPYNEVKVVIIGQDPYHNGVADGLAFSSKDDLRFPPSLLKIYEALEEDIKFGLYLDQNTSLEYLAKQGVLLLNTCLTVDEGNPRSHHSLGWEFFIERVLEVLYHHKHDLVFMLWGQYAKALKPRINNGKHVIFETEHPAYAAREQRKWQHNGQFKKANLFLESRGYGEINW